MVSQLGRYQAAWPSNPARPAGKREASVGHGGVRTRERASEQGIVGAGSGGQGPVVQLSPISTPSLQPLLPRLLKYGDLPPAQALAKIPALCSYSSSRFQSRFGSIPSILGVLVLILLVEEGGGGTACAQRGSPALRCLTSAPVWCSVCSDYCPPWPGAWAPCCAVFVFSGWCRGRLPRLRQRL
jgi:hypothetical protein